MFKVSTESHVAYVVATYLSQTSAFLESVTSKLRFQGGVGISQAGGKGRRMIHISG